MGLLAKEVTAFDRAASYPSPVLSPMRGEGRSRLVEAEVETTFSRARVAEITSVFSPKRSWEIPSRVGKGRPAYGGPGLGSAIGCTLARRVRTLSPPAAKSGRKHVRVARHPCYVEAAIERKPEPNGALVGRGHPLDAID